MPAAAASAQETFYADPSASTDWPANDCRNSATPCKTFAGVLAASRSNGSVLDTIVLAAGTYAGDTLNNNPEDAALTINGPATGSPATITGAAVGTCPSGATTCVLTLEQPSITLNRLTVQASGPTQAGIDISGAGAVLNNVTVTGGAPGIVLGGGTASLSGVTVSSPTAGGIVVTNGATIADSTINGAPTGTAPAIAATGTTLKLQRDRIFAGSSAGAVGLSASQLTMDATLLWGGAYGLLIDATTGDARAVMRGDTVDAGNLFSADATSPAIEAVADNAHAASGAISSSILVDDLSAITANGGTVSVQCGYTNVSGAIGTGFDCAPGATNGNTTNSPTAIFDSGAGEYHLPVNSPARDAGDPSPLAGDESTTDIDGEPRVLAGSCSGGSRRDQGADEARASQCVGGGSLSPDDSNPPPPINVGNVNFDLGGGGGDGITIGGGTGPPASIARGGTVKTFFGKGGAVFVQLGLRGSCPAGVIACPATGQVIALVKPAAKAHGRAAAVKRVVLGTTSQTVAAGHSREIVVQLSKSGVTFLRRHSKVPATLSATITRPGGQAVKFARSGTIALPRRAAAP